MLRLTLWLLLAGLASFSAGLGQDPPLSSDRPSIGEGSTVLPAGYIQVEGGATFSRTGPTESIGAGELLLRYGTSPRTELVLGLNSFVWENSPGSSASGLQDPLVGVRYQVSPGDGCRRPETALLAATTLPAGSRSFGTRGTLQPSVRLAMGWSLSDRVGAGANINATYAGDRQHRFLQAGLGASLNQKASGRVTLFQEYFAFIPASDVDSNAHFLDAGALVMLRPHLQVDGRVGVRLDGDGPDYFLGFGLTWRTRR